MRLSVSIIRDWSRRSTNRSIFLAAVVVGSMTLIVKATALIKDLVVAQTFGVSPDLDAYLVAFILPQFTINVLAGAFHPSLVPTFIEVRDREGHDAAQELFSAVTGRALIILFGGVLLLAGLGPLLLPIIGSGFDPVTMTHSLTMFYITLPAIIISGMGVIWGAVLNAYDRFALAALAPLAVPLATLAIVLMSVQTLGIYALALGLMVGFCMQAVLLAWSLRQRGLRLRPKWQSAHEASVRQVMLQFAPAAAGAMLASGTELVDQAMATPLGPGNVAALNYGTKLLSFVLSIGATALGIAVLPYFSKMVTKRDWVKVKHTYKTYTILILAVSVPIVLVFAVLSEPIVRLLYQRGAFTPEDTVLVSQIQSASFLQVPFYLMGILSVRLISALKMQSVLFWITLLSFSSNIILNYLLSRSFGVAGIALSTSGVYIISFCILAIVLRHRVRHATIGNASVN